MNYINPYRLFVGSFVPNWLLRAPTISHGAKLVYARLCQYADKSTGEAWPNQAELAAEIGTSERQARRYIAELVAAGLIECHRRGLGECNAYRFLHHPMMANVSDPDRTNMSPSFRTEVSSSVRTDVAGPLYIESSIENQDTRASRARETVTGPDTEEASAPNQASPAASARAKASASAEVGANIRGDSKPSKGGRGSQSGDVAPAGEVDEVLEHLKAATGRGFSSAGAQARHVRGRLSGGASVAELVLVVDHRASLWGRDPRMRPYLRPETIFCAAHWEAYLQDAQEWDAGGRRSVHNGAASGFREKVERMLGRR